MPAWNCFALVWLVFMGQTLSITRGLSPRDALANLKVPSTASLRLYLDSTKANVMNGVEIDAFEIDDLRAPSMILKDPVVWEAADRILNRRQEKFNQMSDQLKSGNPKQNKNKAKAAVTSKVKRHGKKTKSRAGKRKRHFKNKLVKIFPAKVDVVKWLRDQHRLESLKTPPPLPSKEHKDIAARMLRRMSRRIGKQYGLSPISSRLQWELNMTRAAKLASLKRRLATVKADTQPSMSSQFRKQILKNLRNEHASTLSRRERSRNKGDPSVKDDTMALPDQTAVAVEEDLTERPRRQKRPRGASGRIGGSMWFDETYNAYLSPEEAHALEFRQIDWNGDGNLEIDELVDWMNDAVKKPEEWQTEAEKLLSASPIKNGEVKMFVTSVDGDGDSLVQWEEYWDAVKAHVFAQP